MAKVARFFVLVAVLCFVNLVNCEPPVQNSGGWGQQNTGGYASGFSHQQNGAYSSGYGGGSPGGFNGGSNNGGGGGWNQQAQTQQNGGGGWGQGQQQQQQVQSSGGWGQGQGQQSQQQSAGWDDNQNQKGQGNGGWGPQLNLELDTGMLKPENLSPGKIFKSLIRIPGKIVNFIKESGLYLLFIPLIIILPLMLLAFNVGRTLGGFGWGWGRSLSSTVESGLIGFKKSPVWKKIGETLMDEKVFERIMKSIDDFKKDW